MQLLVADFRADARELAWSRAFLEARDTVEATRDVRILNVNDAAELGAIPVVMVRVLRPSAVLDETSREELMRDNEAQHATDGAALAVSPCGPNNALAADVVIGWIGHSSARWIVGTSDAEELYETLVECLRLAVDLRYSAPFNEATGVDVLVEELPASAEAARLSPKRFRSPS